MNTQLLVFLFIYPRLLVVLVVILAANLVDFTQLGTFNFLLQIVFCAYQMQVRGQVDHWVMKKFMEE